MTRSLLMLFIIKVRNSMARKIIGNNPEITRFKITPERNYDSKKVGRYKNTLLFAGRFLDYKNVVFLRNEKKIRSTTKT